MFTDLHTCLLIDWYYFPFAVADPDEALAEGERQPPKYVFKLLQKSDIIQKTFVGRDVFVLWPDNGLWYKAAIQKCNPTQMTGTIYYDDTEEQEDDADLDELIRERSLAYRVKRPANYVCSLGEVEGEVYVDRKKRGRQASRPADDEDEDVEEDVEEHVEKEEQGRRKRRPENIISKGESPLSTRPATAAADDAIVRSKVRAAFEQTLEQAVREVGDDETRVKCRQPKMLAMEIELALLNLYGGTTKDYKNKMRTLHFNLKDPQNVELRLHVIRGDISPENFVRMSANELASKELAEYRRKKEEEALKMSVLDAEAAAKFSTAAALDARDRLAMPSAYVADKLLAAREKSPERGEGQGAHQQQQQHQIMRTKETPDADANPATAPPGEGKSVLLPAQPLDWASIKAQAVQRASTEPIDTLHIDTQQYKYQPLPEFESLQAHTSEKAQAEDRNDDQPDSGLENIFLPSEFGFSDGVWQSQLVVPASATVSVTVDAKAGAGDLSVLLGSKELVVRGRLALPKLEAFLSELHLSKHRTATLGVMSVTDAASLKEKNDFSTAIVAGYREQERAGVAEGHPGTETYLIPPSGLANRLCAVTGTSPLDKDHLLALVVHRKELVKSGQRPTVPPTILPTPPNNTATEPKNKPPSLSAPALPPGLDLSAISALAQAFGVAPQPSGGAAPRPMVPPSWSRTGTAPMQTPNPNPTYPPPGVPYRPPAAPRPMAPYKPPPSPQ